MAIRSICSSRNSRKAKAGCAICTRRCGWPRSNTRCTRSTSWCRRRSSPNPSCRGDRARAIFSSACATRCTSSAAAISISSPSSTRNGSRRCSASARTTRVARQRAADALLLPARCRHPRFSEGLIARVTEDTAAGRFMRRTGGAPDSSRRARSRAACWPSRSTISSSATPLNLITIFADCQAHGVELSGSAYQLVRDNLRIDRRRDAQRPADRDGADGNSVGAPARGRDAGGDASRGRARRDHSRVRQSLRARAARPLPYLYRRSAFAGRGARARAAARGRVQGQQSAADRGRARAPIAAAGFSRAAAARYRQGPRPRPSRARRAAHGRSLRAGSAWTARRSTWWCSWCATI